jgi:hypothetical protein
LFAALVRLKLLADMGGMTKLLGWRHLRLAVLLAILGALVVAVVTGMGSTASKSDVVPTTPPLTAAQKTGSINAFEAIAPPSGFGAINAGEWPIRRTRLECLACQNRQSASAAPPRSLY